MPNLATRHVCRVAREVNPAEPQRSYVRMLPLGLRITDPQATKEDRDDGARKGSQKQGMRTLGDPGGRVNLPSPERSD
jgi:hypothetical protein